MIIYEKGALKIIKSIVEHRNILKRSMVEKNPGARQQIKDRAKRVQLTEAQYCCMLGISRADQCITLSSA